LKQLEIVPTAFAKKQENHLLGRRVNQNLALERMPFFLARIEQPLTLLGTFNGSLGDIYEHDLWATKALHQAFLAC
jgi:hypothetical protein